MHGLPGTGTWRKFARARAPGQPAFGDLGRLNGVEWKRGPLERFTGRRCNGAECLISANSFVKGTRALRPRGLLQQPANDWRYCGRSPRLSPFVPPRQEKGEFHACTVPWIVR